MVAGVFFFRQKTAYEMRISDWSSDVGSSVLVIAERCGVTATNAVMVLAGPSLRVVPLTVHIPLAEVPERLTSELIVAKARIVARGLRRDFGIDTPRIALAGLNPHAGENGQLGDEEERVMKPAVAQLAEDRILVDGPVAADALFAPGIRDRYDALLCGYHDQEIGRAHV